MEEIDLWTEALEGCSPELRTWAHNHRLPSDWARCPRAEWLILLLGRAGADREILMRYSREATRRYAAYEVKRDAARSSPDAILAQRWPLPPPPPLQRCRPQIGVAWDRVSEGTDAETIGTVDALGVLPMLVSFRAILGQLDPDEQRALVAIAWRLAAGRAPAQIIEVIRALGTAG